jgi:hypothetical protein
MLYVSPVIMVTTTNQIKHVQLDVISIFTKINGIIVAILALSIVEIVQVLMIQAASIAEGDHISSQI